MLPTITYETIEGLLIAITYGIIEGLLIALVALAFQLSYSGLKLFDVGIGGLYVAASYIYIGVCVGMSKLGLGGSGSLIAAVIPSIAAFISAALLTLFIEFLVYRPFSKKKASSLVMLLISLSVYTVIVNVIAMLAGAEIKYIQLGLEGKLNIAGVVITKLQLFQVTISVIALVAVYLLLSKTLIGKKVTALSENLTLFKILGFDENRTREKILIISAILVSIASILKTAETGIDPFNNGFHIVLLAAVAVIVGGIRSYKGAILGSILLGLIMGVAKYSFAGDWKEAAAFVLLIIVLFFKKDGLFYTQLRAES